MKTDITKLHEIHQQYPNTPRRKGKTTYCFDSLLRASQTGYYKTLCYLTSNERATHQSFRQFIDFLEALGEIYRITDECKIVLNCCEITFKSVIMKYETRGYHGYVEDLFISCA